MSSVKETKEGDVDNGIEKASSAGVGSTDEFKKREKELDIELKEQRRAHIKQMKQELKTLEEKAASTSQLSVIMKYKDLQVQLLKMEVEFKNDGLFQRHNEISERLASGLPPH